MSKLAPVHEEMSSQVRWQLLESSTVVEPTHNHIRDSHAWFGRVEGSIQGSRFISLSQHAPSSYDEPTTWQDTVYCYSPWLLEVYRLELPRCHVQVTTCAYVGVWGGRVCHRFNYRATNAPVLVNSREYASCHPKQTTIDKWAESRSEVSVVLDNGDECHSSWVPERRMITAFQGVWWR
jgi:hypothetical protein